MPNIIHPTVIISKRSLIGENIFIGPYTIIGPNVQISDGVHIEGFSSIGAPPEHKDFWSREDACQHGVYIGKSVTIREFVTVHAGINRTTFIGNDCHLLSKSHVGHDALVEEDCGIGHMAVVGGHVHVMRGCQLGIGAMTHQWILIPPYCMIGMNAAVTKKHTMKPFETWGGVPAKYLKDNDYKKANFSKEDIEKINEMFEIKKKEYTIFKSLGVRK